LVDALRPLGLLDLLHLSDDIGTKTAWLARVLTGGFARRPFGPVSAGLAPAAAIFAADHLAIGARFGTGSASPFAPLLRFGRGGLKGQGKRERQGCQRSARCKIELHCSDSRIAGPPQAAC
jgi:hypothetical protein